jgi:hypothetical protein
MLWSPKRYTVPELTIKALELLPEQDYAQIRQHPQERLAELHFTLAMLLRTELCLWQRKVEDENGSPVHPDDDTTEIMK